jgi:hypothetical protein
MAFAYSRHQRTPISSTGRQATMNAAGRSIALQLTRPIIRQRASVQLFEMSTQNARQLERNMATFRTLHCTRLDHASNEPDFAMGEACGICAQHGLETANHGWTIWSGYGASGVPGKYVIAWDTNTHA